MPSPSCSPPHFLPRSPGGGAAAAGGRRHRRYLLLRVRASSSSAFGDALPLPSPRFGYDICILTNGIIGNLYSRVYDDPVEEEGMTLDEAGNFNDDIENNMEEGHARQKQEMCLGMNTVTQKNMDGLAVIKEGTNIEDLIKVEKAEDVDLDMIVDEVVLVGNGLAGALQFSMKCSTEAFVTKQASDANGSGFSVVEKEHPRSLTPMLWAKKVEHFSEHQTKRPCWEQCLRHLQRDRRTEPAVDLTVVSRFRALTDSNDSASTSKGERRRKRPKHGGGGHPPNGRKGGSSVGGSIRNSRSEERRGERRRRDVGPTTTAVTATTTSTHQANSMNYCREREGEGYRGQCATLFVGVGPPRPG
uniref:Uncharacterized protein n=1 Tax=Oryza punctata TaxID=4537 RepID=A0A0E0KVB7_ORYPU